MLEHAHKMIQHTTTIINYYMNDNHYLSSNKWVHYPLLEVRGITTTQTVLVIAEGAQELLLGKDHPIPQQILDTLKANPETLDKQLCTVTRAESQKVARQEREDEEAEVQDGALLRTAEPDQPEPILPDQSHALPASNPCVYQPQAKEKVEQKKNEGEMGVEVDKDEVDWDDED